jgi:hypothetical protein
MSRVYDGSKPEARHQLVEVIDEAAFGIRNELGCIQWHNWQHACSLMMGISNMLCNLETELL